MQLLRQRFYFVYILERRIMITTSATDIDAKEVISRMQSVASDPNQTAPYSTFAQALTIINPNFSEFNEIALSNGESLTELLEDSLSSDPAASNWLIGVVQDDQKLASLTRLIDGPSEQAQTDGITLLQKGLMISAGTYTPLEGETFGETILGLSDTISPERIELAKDINIHEITNIEYFDHDALAEGISGSFNALVYDPEETATANAISVGSWFLGGPLIKGATKLGGGAWNGAGRVLGGAGDDAVKAAAAVGADDVARASTAKVLTSEAGQSLLGRGNDMFNAIKAGVKSLFSRRAATEGAEQAASTVGVQAGREAAEAGVERSVKQTARDLANEARDASRGWRYGKPAATQAAITDGVVDGLKKAFPTSSVAALTGVASRAAQKSLAGNIIINNLGKLKYAALPVALGAKGLGLMWRNKLITTVAAGGLVAADFSDGEISKTAAAVNGVQTAAGVAVDAGAAGVSLAVNGFNAVTGEAEATDPNAAPENTNETTQPNNGSVAPDNSEESGNQNTAPEGDQVDLTDQFLQQAADGNVWGMLGTVTSGLAGDGSSLAEEGREMIAEGVENAKEMGTNGLLLTKSAFNVASGASIELFGETATKVIMGFVTFFAARMGINTGLNALGIGKVPVIGGLGRFAATIGAATAAFNVAGGIQESPAPARQTASIETPAVGLTPTPI